MAQRFSPAEKAIGNKGYNRVSSVTTVKDEDEKDDINE